MRKFNQVQVDRICQLRRDGLSWREIAERTGICATSCRALHQRGHERKKPRAYPAGARDRYTVGTTTKTLREWAVDWLARWRPEREPTDKNLWAAVKILRRRQFDGWPPQEVVGKAPRARRPAASVRHRAEPTRRPVVFHHHQPAVGNPAELLVVQMRMHSVI